MSLTPLTSASAVIQMHAWAALLALAVGVYILIRPKGSIAHRWMGRFWLMAMLVAVLSSFFIHELRTWGPWSPIHILSLITLILMVRAYQAIRQRRVPLHAELMKSAFYNALLLATFFTFLPGRIMHEVVFGPSGAKNAYAAIPLWAWILIGVALVMGGRHLLALWSRKRLSAKKAGRDLHASTKHISS